MTSALFRYPESRDVMVQATPRRRATLVDELLDEPALRGYPSLASARGDLLAKLRRGAEARLELERAAQLTKNGRLLARARSCRS